MTCTDDPLGHRWTAVRLGLHDQLRTILDRLAVDREGSAYADCARRAREVLAMLADGSTLAVESVPVAHGSFGAALEAMSARRLPPDDLDDRRRLVRAAFEHAWDYTGKLSERNAISRRDAEAALAAASHAVALVELELGAVLRGGHDQCPNCGSPHLALAADESGLSCPDCGWAARPPL